MSIGALLGILFVVSLFMGVPIAVSLGVASIIGFLIAEIPLTYIAQTAFDAINEFTIIAVPMFILAGSIMEKGGLTEKLIDFSRAIIGNVRGGLAVVTVVACTLFAAISGSGVATAAAIGSMLIPAMIREGYHKEFAGAITACSGGIGAVIPPSILIIIYGVTSEASITELFIAGIFPGILLGLFLILAVYIISRKRKYSRIGGHRSLREILDSTYQAKWAIIAPVIILGGIYLGIVTVTEASVVAVLYALFVTWVIYRKLTGDDFKQSLIDAARISGTVLFVMATGSMFGRLMSIYQIPQNTSQFLISTIHSPVLLVLMIDAVLIFIGMWMESATQIILLTPLLLPVVTELGISPIQFGIMFVIACEIGFETPPLGINLFVASEISGSTIEEISKEAIIFVAAESAALVLVSLLPQITAALPRWLGM